MASPETDTRLRPVEEHVDVLIVGGGLSGIGAACHLRRNRPEQSFLIVEARDAIGGTWDLFRYPGIRSDSDMFTLGYCFKPWEEPQALADGPSIRSYIREAATENALSDRIRLQTKVLRAEWSTERAQWSVELEGPDGARSTVTCAFLFGCTGYYSYDEPYTPRFEGIESFRGTVVHPQHWPEDLDYAGKRVVVIGSGATAVTLVPAMAGTAEHVTMLQRSPSYVLSLPGRDPLAELARRWLPIARRLRVRALEERADGARALHPQPQAPGAHEAAAAPRDPAPAPGGLRRRHPLQPGLRPLGPAHVPGSRRRPVRGDLLRRCLRRDRRDRQLHRGRPAARPTGDAWTRTS